MKKYFQSPYRQYVLISALTIAFAISHFLDGKSETFLFSIAFIGAIDTAIDGFKSLRRGKIGIDTFNIFAVIIAFVARDFSSAVFIVLMLTFADLLEWKTEARAGNAIKELLALKPRRAIRELPGGEFEEIDAAIVRKNDVLIVKNGTGIPVDGIVVQGKADVNEASVTGESRLVEKIVGDTVLSGTLNAAGFLKIKATRVGEDSTLDQMIKLVREAAANKSRSEKLADKFAGIFLPFVILLGASAYLITGNLVMTGALFLVACADDMAVAIPLAVAAAIGQAAKRGVIVKGGEWLDAASRIKTIVLDKTGTLTYGAIAVKNVFLEEGVSETRFWRAAGGAEKFSVHPFGKAVYRAAMKNIGEIPDPEDYKLVEGKGVRIRKDGENIFVGNISFVYDHDVPLSPKTKELFESAGARGETAFFVIAEKTLLGIVSVADTVRSEAKESMLRLRALGVETVMLTGDNPAVAKEAADALGIEKFHASMKPEDKLREIEKLLPRGTLAMVGDGINDAPALSRADIGIAMGGGGTTVAVEAADIVILTDDLSRLPEMVELGRRTRRVVYTDIVLWVTSNAVGFVLVFTGIAGLAFAAFYNFATDFLPLINSAMFFRERKKKN